MTGDTWAMYLVNLASHGGAATRPAIRHLFYAGHEVEWIAEACDLDIAVVRSALNKIP